MKTATCQGNTVAALARSYVEGAATRQQRLKLDDRGLRFADCGGAGALLPGISLRPDAIVADYWPYHFFLDPLLGKLIAIPLAGSGVVPEAHTARARVKTSTLRAPAPSSVRAHSSRVAPVVITSSTSSSL